MILYKHQQVDFMLCACDCVCMATKTISVNLEAYDKLVAARSTNKESFSQVICRAEWPPPRGTAGDLLRAMKTQKSTADIEFLEDMKKNPLPYDDPWDRE